VDALVVTGPDGVSRTSLAGVGADIEIVAADTAAAREALRVALDRATAVVYVSTAAVYGAWPDNAVPLTEDAPLRPNPGFAPAAEHAELERIVRDWRGAAPARTLAVLRPVTVVGGGPLGPLASSLVGAAPVRPRTTTPLVQYVHVDDVIAAVQLAVERRLDGTFNVAPTGWIAGEDAAALRGDRRRLGVPAPLMRVLARSSWRGSEVARARSLPFLVHPWVVANDRLRAAGWRPRFTNEEAFVAALDLPQARRYFSAARRG
jgi:nucleoside-diphosphate-sugar epimerase